MKHLSLYIDKWYIVGTVIDDSGPHPLCLSNNEERIWLYFRNNVSANSVEYGKSFRESAYAGELNYYADIFNLIPGSEDKTFKLYGTNVEMRNIFETAGVFSDLRNGFSDSEKIPTYVSFSTDIRLDAQSIFLELLKEKDFDVKEYVADIERLALEYTRRRNRFSEEMYFLVANACNENLHYSLYHYAEGMFKCDMHKTLSGKGEDLRSHALLVQVVEYLNAETHFLQSDEEKESEYRYLSKFTEEWLNLIDETPNGEPTPLGYINLRRQKGNAYHVSVMKDDVDKRTASIIDDVVREMTRMISKCNVELHQIGCVVFLGDTFENQQFQSKLKKQIADTQYIHYRERELANVVSVYKELPKDLFDSAEIDFKQKSEAQAQQALEIRKRREEIEKAKKLDEEQRRVNDEKAKDERNKQEALKLAEVAERNHKYTDALDLYKAALANSPENTYIQEKIDEITDLIAEQKSKKKQYNNYISTARSALDSKNWTEAETQSQMALNVMPDSDEAKHIQEQAKKMRIKYDRLKEALVKLDTLIEQKEYNKAQQELQNISLLGVKDRDIEDRKATITNAISEVRQKIDSERAKLANSLSARNFGDAVKACEVLILIDKEQSSSWAEKLSEVKALQIQETEKQQRIVILKQQIQKAHVDEEWSLLLQLCDDLLTVESNPVIQSLRQKANEKLTSAKYLSMLEDALRNEDWSLILQLSEKEPMLREDKYCASIIREARRQIQIQKRKKSLRVTDTTENTSSPIDDSPELSTAPKRRFPKPHKRAVSNTTDEAQAVSEDKIIDKNPNKKKFPKNRRNINN